MIGLDTTLLVEAEVADSPRHEAAMAFIRNKTGGMYGKVFALAPQVLTEFIHVVSDPKRFAKPLTAAQAVDRAEFWWSAKEVERVLPGHEATMLFLRWMRDHNLGRKRVLDTYLAATYFAAGVGSIATSNGRDYTAFGVFEVIEP